MTTRKENNTVPHRFSRHRFSRRHVLRGASAALALPWLDSLAPAASHAQVGLPKRFLPVYMSNGASILWRDTTGSGVGDSWQLSRVLSPFAPVKSKMLLVRALASFTWRSDLLDPTVAWDTVEERNDFCGVCARPNGAYIIPSHSRDPAALMNCIDGDAYRVGIGQSLGEAPDNPQTVDDLIATTLGYRSLQLGLLDGDGELDQRNAALSRTLTYDAQGQPKPKQIDPAVVFADLFGASEESEEERALNQALAASRLDALEESIQSVQARLGTSDRTTLEQFLTGVRELELDISALNGSCAAASARNIEPIPGLLGPGEIGYSADAPSPATPEKQWLRAQTMNDLIVLALQCDSAQVVSYMLDNSRSDLAYDWVPELDFFTDGTPPVGGVCGAYHEASHASRDEADNLDPARNQQFHSITNWHCQVVSDLIQKMDAVPEADGTLLDNSVVMLASGMQHADHAAWNLPFALFGGGSGTFRRDELVDLPTELSQLRQLRDFYFTLLNEYFEMGVTAFGDDMRGVPNALIEEMLA